MIKKIVTIEFKDDHKETFECSDPPRMNGPFYTLYLSWEHFVDIPIEQINRVITREVWRKKSNAKPIRTSKKVLGFQRK